MVRIFFEKRLRQRLRLSDMSGHFLARRLRGKSEWFYRLGAAAAGDVSIDLRSLDIIGGSVKQVRF